jgi:predicted adenine nucleotide alpha hydrolase (AANH) superfamily ATPase
MVNRVGREEGERAGVRFLEADMKKGNGYLKSVRASREMGLYRQGYCGCRYSMRWGRERTGGSVRESPC